MSDIIYTYKCKKNTTLKNVQKNTQHSIFNLSSNQSLDIEISFGHYHNPYQSTTSLCHI